ncbi:transposase [candidate division KSB1 bacterium]|nr:transposase [candidate division KSB1 bacterium]
MEKQITDHPMYEYRKMSEAERKEIIDYREARGYPLHAPPHPYRGFGYYLITAANYEHQPIMNSSKRRTEFEVTFLKTLCSEDIEILGWIILPNHYHCLLKLTDLNILSKKIKLLHGSTSHDWNKEDGLQGKRKIWYKFSDRYLRTESQYYAALNYIHFNPVKHHYCKRAADWMWSSLNLYLQDLGREWVLEKWKKYTPRDNFGIGWDEM